MIIKNTFDAANVSGVSPRLVFCIQDAHCNFEAEFGINIEEIGRQGGLLEPLNAKVALRLGLFRTISDGRFPELSLKPAAQGLSGRLKNQRANNSGL
ncbi:MAG: hypothetical protein PHE11_06400 [Candidatus Omnitrophica bacterium]|nr:hypothetical protein [Candidatus Omnitrophota bacterium]MDD5527012.1 hypothetical protein [Candidatus Omnitrophota bacterium]